MTTTLTSKGQVTIPKPIREALHLQPGSPVDFVVNDQGQVVIIPAQSAMPSEDRFARVRGTATVKWRTDTLMQLLRDDA